MESPTYFLAQAICDQNGLIPVRVPTDDDGMDVDALEGMLAADEQLRCGIWVMPMGSIGAARCLRLCCLLCFQLGWQALAR